MNMSDLHVTEVAQSPVDDPLKAPERVVTFRAVMLGAVLAMGATVAGSYARFILHTTRLDQNHLSMAAVFPLVLIALFLARPFKLTRGELVVIFCMPLIGATMPTYFIGKLLAYISAPHYMASAENQWAVYFGTYLPTFAVMPEGEAVRWFYEGLPLGASIPWTDWFVPVFWWITVVTAFYGCCLFLMVILRKQWVVHERIDFPLMELPLAILEPPEEGRFFRIPVLNQGVFWLGFVPPLLIISWNMISYFTPTFPAIPWHLPSIAFGPEFRPMRVNLYPVVVGFGYFIKLDLLFGLWLFNVLTTLEVGFLNRLGFKTEFAGLHSTTPLAIGAQSGGAVIVILLVGFWMGRGHLKDVFRKAFKSDSSVDDSDEILSYRTAVYGFLICGLYLAAWHYWTGMELRFLPLFMFGTLIAYLGITRLIAESGVISLRIPLMPQSFGVIVMGSNLLTQRTLISVALSYALTSDVKTNIMPALAHSLRLFETLHTHRRKLVWPLVVAMASGMFATFIYTIYVGYEYGAANHGSMFTQDAASGPWDEMVKRAKSPDGPAWELISFIAAGAATCGLMMFVRYRYPGFPLHPVGFAAGPAIPVRDLAAPFFIVWVAKSVIVRLGGIQSYRAARPFFIGLILGHFVGASISFVVDMIWFPGQGHSVPFSDW